MVKHGRNRDSFPQYTMLRPLRKVENYTDLLNFSNLVNLNSLIIKRIKFIKSLRFSKLGFSEWPQCLNRRMLDMKSVSLEVDQLVKQRNENEITTNWQFSVNKARCKLVRHYPIN